MQQSVGTLIWLSIRPLISRLWLSAAFGFAITKAHIFPLEASRGTGQIVLNVTLPCLMFSKIVPAFTAQNISALGPIVAIAFLYEAIGLLLAWLVKQFFWLPHRFRYGILCAGAVSNYSDIPTAVITSITASSPFNPSTDQNLSVAYVAGFILVFFITLFPLGSHRLVAMDFDGPNVEDADLRMSCVKKTQQSTARLAALVRRRGSGTKPADVEKSENQSESEKPGQSRLSYGDAECQQMVESKERPRLVEENSASAPPYLPDASTAAPSLIPSRVPSPQPFSASASTAADSSPLTTPAQINATPAVTNAKANQPEPIPTQASEAAVTLAAAVQSRPSFRVRALAVARSATRSLLMPCSVTIVFSIVIAVVTPLKALFTPIANSPIPNAPDGQPPLAFILDCATFVGAASVPLGLICLGSAVARVQLPRSREEWGELPLGAIIAFSTTKMLLLPVLGVLIVQGLVRVGFVDANDKVLRFVCMFISCVPTATSQVYLTQVYSGTGEAGTLPLFLVPQYILMFISMTVLTAYSLSILF